MNTATIETPRAAGQAAHYALTNEADGWYIKEEVGTAAPHWIGRYALEDFTLASRLTVALREAAAGGRLALRCNRERTVLKVSSLRHAQAIWNRHRTESGVGSREAPSLTVVDTATGKPLAAIAYNGTVRTAGSAMQVNPREERQS
jgi:hypothetical protein